MDPKRYFFVTQAVNSRIDISKKENESYWKVGSANSIVKCFLSVPSGVESALNEPNRKFGNFGGGRKSELD